MSDISKETEHRANETAEKTARKLSSAGLGEFVRYLRSPWQIIWSNLLAGVFRGLGFILGATVVIATITYILVKILGGLPLVGEWFQDIGAIFQNIQKASENFQGLGK